MELKDTIYKIDALKIELDDLGPLPKDAMERLEQKIRMEWNYHSNVIEGNQLDYGETRSLLLWGITAKGKPLKDHLDLEGHNEAIKKLESIAIKEIPITESLIQEFHKLILAEPFEEYRKDVIVGDFKESNNYLYNKRGERIDFCPPEEVHKRLNELINWTNNAISPPKRKKKQYDIHPLLIAARFHYDFINIHPFDDGNGRLSRIFMNLILMQCGYPPIIIHKDLRPQYFSAIEDSRERGIEVLAEFLGEQLIKSLELYLKAAKGESIEEPDDLDKEIALLKAQLDKSMEIVLTKSDEIVKDIYEKSLKPLFESVEKKLSKFDELFAEKNHSYTLNNFHGDSIKYIEQVIYRNFYSTDHISSLHQKDINNIKIDFYWRDLKKNGVNVFNASVDLNVDLQNAKYRIFNNQNAFKTIEKVYSEYLEKEELDFISMSLGKFILDFIKGQVKK